MEILKRGTPPGDVKYEATCNHCKTVVQFKRDEATVTSDQREGDYMSVTCPVCYSQIHKALRYDR